MGNREAEHGASHATPPESFLFQPFFDVFQKIHNAKFAPRLRCEPSIAVSNRHCHYLNKWFKLANMDKYHLKLYITGKTPRSESAIQNLRKICEENLDQKYEIEIIDILERPQLAEDERILATPTLIKSLPPPLRRLIGDLSETEKVLVGLDIRTSKSSVNPN